MTAREAKRQRVERFQSLPAHELDKQIAWARRTVRQVQRDLSEMLAARRKLRRKRVG